MNHKELSKLITDVEEWRLQHLDGNLDVRDSPVHHGGGQNHLSWNCSNVNLIDRILSTLRTKTNHLIEVPGSSPVHWVNPTHVTSIEPYTPNSRLACKVWVRGHSGYGTYSIDSTETPKTVAAHLNSHEVQN